MLNFIRNFAIVAHIDHGKSTLSDRLIEICKGLTVGSIENQVLDSLIVEKERGITVKAQCVRLEYFYKDNKYILNLIDTPGHVDFFFEVFRSLEVCDGVILLVDSTQGVEAQTISNYQYVRNKGLKIIPVLNKVDSKIADIDSVSKSFCNLFKFSLDSLVKISAKFGFGINTLLDKIITELPHPSGSISSKLQLLVIDSWFDTFLGIVVLVCVKNGCVSVKDKVKVISSGKVFFVESLGVFVPEKKNLLNLSVGEIGFAVLGIKDINCVQLGDTITTCYNGSTELLPYLKSVQQKVYAGFYPVVSNFFSFLKKALEKLHLNDSSFCFEMENSSSLGFGFRCGFLGTLHLEIIKDRLRDEFNVDVIVTVPTVTYECFFLITKKVIYINNPIKLSNFGKFIELREPFAFVTIYTPGQFVGKIINLCLSRRGIQKELRYCENFTLVFFEIPLCELIIDFFSLIKSLSNGFASVDYIFSSYVKSDLVRLDILINGKVIDAFSLFVHTSFSFRKGRELVLKLKELLPCQLFPQVIQAAVGKKILVREVINPLRKNVISKCYGGDVTRKKKLLEKQKLGKKKLKKQGHVVISKFVFLKLMNIGK